MEDGTRNRGSKEDRTCPHCGKVFTSELGQQYHVNRQVCISTASASASQTKQKNNQPDTIDLTVPFATLAPGTQFLTSTFGVVEVVRDDRDVPEPDAAFPLKQQVRSYSSSKTKLDHQLKRALATKMVHATMRRRQVNQLLSKKGGASCTPKSINQVYFSGNYAPSKYSKFPQRLEDPSLPAKAKPYRIVECISVPDVRDRLVGPQGDASDIQPIAPFRAKLFLPRHLLTERYTPNVPHHVCETCGRSFQSLPGIRYHAKGNVCTTKRHAATVERIERSHSILNKAKKQLKMLQKKGAQSIRLDDEDALGALERRASKRSSTGGDEDTMRSHPKTKRRRRKESSMYPQVLLHLGYKLIVKDKDKQRPSFSTLFATAPQAIASSSTGVTATATTPSTPILDAMLYRADNPDRHLPPDDIVQDLQRQLKDIQSQGGAAMYDQVFTSLQYKKAKASRSKKTAKRRKRKAKQPPPALDDPSEDDSSEVVPQSMEVEQNEAPASNNVPIIDVDALLAEIESGRYPSMKRLQESNEEEEDDPHDDYCAICKKGGELYCCDYCPVAEHIECVWAKFYQIPEPETSDDFLCHRCIGKILSKRRRAAKRTNEKLLRQQQQKGTATMPNENEYVQLAQTGTELADLVELLQDAKFRLTQSMERAKQNAARRRMLMDAV